MHEKPNLSPEILQSEAQAQFQFFLENRLIDLRKQGLKFGEISSHFNAIQDFVLNKGFSYASRSQDLTLSVEMAKEQLSKIEAEFESKGLPKEKTRESIEVLLNDEENGDHIEVDFRAWIQELFTKNEKALDDLKLERAARTTLVADDLNADNRNQV